MKHKRVWHLLNIIGLLLCITVSFAWMNENNENIPVARYPAFDFYSAGKNLSVAGNDIVASVYYMDGDEKVLMSSSDDLTEEPVFEVTDDFAPGDREIFVMEITNNAPQSAVVSMSFSEIEEQLKQSTDPSIVDQLYIGIVSTDGFDLQNKAPVLEDTCFGDLYTRGVIPVFSNISVPGNSKTVSIRFYIRFSSQAGNEFMDRDFQIGKIDIIAA